MLVYRITLAKYAGKLMASGRAARWNPNDVRMIYTASSRSLACLENVVHRDRLGLSQLFSIITLEFPDNIAIKTIPITSLPDDWSDYDQMRLTQRIGEQWIKDHESVILKVPSSIIPGETNYLLNPDHADFKQIKLLNTRALKKSFRIRG